jgi:hypothetical protein
MKSFRNWINKFSNYFNLRENVSDYIIPLFNDLFSERDALEQRIRDINNEIDKNKLIYFKKIVHQYKYFIVKIKGVRWYCKVNFTFDDSNRVSLSRTNGKDYICGCEQYQAFEYDEINLTTEDQYETMISTTLDHMRFRITELEGENKWLSHELDSIKNKKENL